MYVSIAEVRAAGQSVTASAVPPATDTLLQDVIERVSRAFDHACGVADEYFEPAYYPTWESLHIYVVGDVVTPTTGNLHIYRVTTAGTSGATEPTWPLTAAGTVTNGNVVFTEHGADVVATERDFYPDGTKYLKIDPFVPGTMDATIEVPTGYTAPYYVERNGWLVLTGSDHVLPEPGYRYNGSLEGWSTGLPVTVTAKWGYAETPADVKMAIIEWAINVWRETDPAGLKLVGLEGQVLRETMPPRVAEVARYYRTNAVGVALV